MPHQNKWVHVGGHLRRTRFTESDASQFYWYRARPNRRQQVDAFKMDGGVLGFVELVFQQEVMLFPTNPLSDGFRAITFIAPAPGQTISDATSLSRYPREMLMSFSLPLGRLLGDGWFVFNGPNPVPLLD